MKLFIFCLIFDIIFLFILIKTLIRVKDNKYEKTDGYVIYGLSAIKLVSYALYFILEYDIASLVILIIDIVLTLLLLNNIQFIFYYFIDYKRFGYKSRKDLCKNIYYLFENIVNAEVHNSIDKIKNEVTDKCYDELVKNVNNTNRKNIISDLKYINTDIIKIVKNVDTITILADIEVYGKDYYIDTNKDYIIEGNDRKEKHTYRLSLTKIVNKEGICQFCGAKLNENSNRCPSCNMVIKTQLLIDEIEKIR